MKSILRLTMAVCLTGLLLCANAWAISLQDAKTARLVGEQTNGYLGLVVDSPETRILVLTINAKRKHHYERIANKNNISLDEVAKLAAEKAIEAANSGHMIQNLQGQWQKK